MTTADTNRPMASSRFDWLALLMWWVAFGTATVTLSKVFETSRLLTSGAVGSSWLPLVGWGLLLFAAVFYLGYRSYENLKRKGELGRQWSVYERLYARFNQAGGGN